VDQKLEEFLNLHSAYLTPIIADFLKKRKNKDPGLQVMISDLSLLAFERNLFIKKLEKIDQAFS
jgi:hypothetical protein